MVAAVMAQLLQSPPNQQLKEIDYACLRQPPYAYGGLPPGWCPAVPNPNPNPALALTLTLTLALTLTLTPTLTSASSS